MKTRKILLLILPAAMLLLASCTKLSGVIDTRHYDVTYPNYYQLDISDNVSVTMTDEVDDIVITADENIFEDLEVVFSNGKLRIYRRKLASLWEDPTEILIPYNPYLREITMSSSAEFYTPYGISGDFVKINASSYCKFEGYISAVDATIKGTDDSKISASLDVENNLGLRLSSNSKAELEGSTATLSLDLSSNSTLDCYIQAGYYIFECDYCYGTMKDNCTAYLHCYDRLAVNLTNNSTLYYTGNPDDYECLTDDSSDLINY